jgi:hypothetical protein
MMGEVQQMDARSDQPGPRIVLPDPVWAAALHGSAGRAGQTTTTEGRISMEESASERGRRVINALSAKGAELGFTTVCEYPVQGGRLDVVWLLPATTAIPGVGGPLPVVGFEVESSWRTRKHLKGDYLNLHDLGAALGVIVLLGDGDDVEATRRFAQAMVDRPGPRVLVWAEQDVHQLLTAGTAAGGAQTGFMVDLGEPVPTSEGDQAHTGKYRALWA